MWHGEGEAEPKCVKGEVGRGAEDVRICSDLFGLCSDYVRIMFGFVRICSDYVLIMFWPAGVEWAHGHRFGPNIHKSL